MPDQKPQHEQHVVKKPEAPDLNDVEEGSDADAGPVAPPVKSPAKPNEDAS